ncbi:MAG: hypothetical protein GF329_00905 [Candidatus Lokiarchaeota archaeon]|nr:hypothetical protein [Candidatus Lokiarchaeota archaeon]
MPEEEKDEEELEIVEEGPEEVTEKEADTVPEMRSEEKVDISEGDAQQDIQTGSMKSYEIDALLATQAQQLMNEFQVELVNGTISRVKIYLDISLEEHYIIGIDFSAYPTQKPLISVQESVKEKIGNPEQALNTLKNWDPNNPPTILDIVRELETVLYEISMYKTQANQISHEFKIEPAGDTRNHYYITFMTYGWKEYKIDIYLQSQFNPPQIKFPPELEKIIGPPQNIDKIKNWNPEYQINSILRDIQWMIDQHERMNFEINLLRGGLQNVRYDENQRKVFADVKGTLNTEDKLFSFAVEIPQKYPMAKPIFSLTTEIQDDKLANSMSETTEAVLATWEPFNYLIDVFNVISKSIFSASVLSCIICHKIECPICGKPLSTQDGSEACFFKCPHCGKPYHLHCWEQNIEAINKCAFCLRTPPVASGRTSSTSSQEPPSNPNGTNSSSDSSLSDN